MSLLKYLASFTGVTATLDARAKTLLQLWYINRQQSSIDAGPTNKRTFERSELVYQQPFMHGFNYELLKQNISKPQRNINRVPVRHK